MSDAKSLPPAPEQPLLDQPKEEKLRQEVESLRKQLEEERKRNEKERAPKRPSRGTLWILGLAIAGVLLLALLLGLVPHYLHERQLRNDARAEASALPVITYIYAQHSAAGTRLVLPGSMEAITEAPVLARADGYLKRRYVDIGDKIMAGQLLADIAAPDLDQQVEQGRAQLLQARAALRQASAALEQARANQALAKVTADRWAALLKRGAVAPQDNDTQQANYRAQTANVVAMEEAESAARQNALAAQANLDRLLELQGYEQVRAPFSGTVTLRNIDVGALIANGQTLLFRIAQTDRLRTFVDAPEANSALVQTGQKAQLAVAEFPGRQFTGEITRTSRALDPSTRTLVIEVQVVNSSGILMPGMFSEVTLNETRTNPPVLIPADALIVRSDGAFAAVLQGNGPDVESPEAEGSGGGRSQGGQNKDGKNGNKQNGQKDKGKGGKQAKQEKNDKQDKAELEKQQKELPTFTVHLTPVSIGRDYGNAVEILTGLNGGERVVESPNDFIQENAMVKGEIAKENPVTTTAAPGGKQQNANSEKLKPEPGAEPTPQQPSKEQTNRGPGH